MLALFIRKKHPPCSQTYLSTFYTAWRQWKENITTDQQLNRVLWMCSGDVRRQPNCFNSPLDSQMNNVFSTSKCHQPAMNSLYNACLPPDRWNTGQRCVCLRACVVVPCEVKFKKGRKKKIHIQRQRKWLECFDTLHIMDYKPRFE